MSSVLLSPAGVPGAVSPTVEPFTKNSVLITWDPPAEPNDDIELLKYNVYFQIRDFGQPQAFSIDVPNPAEENLPWNTRSLQVSGVTQQQFVVAYVVAVSANGVGAVASQQSYGITYGNSEYEGGVGWGERVSCITCHFVATLYYDLHLYVYERTYVCMYVHAYQSSA